jgi:hypothetical protein
VRQVCGLTADELRAIDRDDALTFLQKGKKVCVPGRRIGRSSSRMQGGGR